MSGIADFTVKAADGSAVDMGRYAGRVLLIVNTASQMRLHPAI